MNEKQINNMYEIIKYTTIHNLNAKEKIYNINYINKDYFVKLNIEKFNDMYKIGKLK
jgi:hypothetical protein